MLLDDFVEGGEHCSDGVVAGAHVSLRVSAGQLLNQVPHRVFPCDFNVNVLISNVSSNS